MIKLCAPFSIILLLGSLVLARADSEPTPLEIESQSEVEFDLNTGIGSATNGVRTFLAAFAKKKLPAGKQAILVHA